LTMVSTQTTSQLYENLVVKMKKSIQLTSWGYPPPQIWKPSYVPVLTCLFQIEPELTRGCERQPGIEILHFLVAKWLNFVYIRKRVNYAMEKQILRLVKDNDLPRQNDEF
jgi:hypothetical protein